ncbi:YqzE family protein [Ornithinibacillus halotolerans]|uniref:YqzE family protein n=1 Tax=Ornithinibacillus halotolerans TaxID=1274357 RepID=A0A916RTI9_9BACI|nr:YqzE family protein [Ornithinibacillus halotolerans]
MKKEVITIKGNDYVKYMTEQVVSYIDQPKEVRKQKRLEQKANSQMLPIGNKWFGALPFAIKSMFKKVE